MALKNRQNNRNENDFYEDIDTIKPRSSDDYQENSNQLVENRQGKNCLSLALVWLILYSGLVFAIWKIVPSVRATQKNIDQAKKEFKEKRTDSSSFFQGLKDRFNQGLTNTKQNLQNQATNRIEVEKEKAIESTKEQITNSLNNLK